MIAAVCGLSVAGCSTGPPRPISAAELHAAELFPYYRVYWAGRVFERVPVTAADGIAGYIPSVGESVDYGDCDKGHGILHTGGCTLPLSITTMVYHRHPNQPLGSQRNILLRGVPAAVYAGGHAIEIYTGRLAIDVLADSSARAMQAALALRPVNAPGRAGSTLPPPAYCPQLYGPAPHYPVARAPDGRLDCISPATVQLEGGS